VAHVKRRWRSSAEEAAHAKIPHGRRSAEILRHGSLEVRWYAPRGGDPQTPHDRDELYVVARGSGTFVRGAERVRFGPNDVLFVPAKLEHRFEDFSDDFAAWVVFWGPKGGERDNPFV
jgi:mannose-6-phosphate isomerase-like protein (cupin superfamily)